MIFNYLNTLRKNEFKIPFNNITNESLHLGVLLAIVGGFLDAYTYIARGGVFANAQTGNIVLLGVEAAKGNFRQATMSLAPILAFILGVIICEWSKKLPNESFIKDSPRAVLILEVIILFIIGFIPNTVPNDIVNITVSFVSSLQICTFRTLVDSPYSTTMCTGNLRSASYAAYVAFTEKDKKAAVRSLRYFVIIFFFLFGALLGGFLTLNFGIKAIWSAALILVFSIIVFSIDELRNKRIA